MYVSKKKVKLMKTLGKDKKLSKSRKKRFSHGFEEFSSRGRKTRNRVVTSDIGTCQIDKVPQQSACRKEI